MTSKSNRKLSFILYEEQKAPKYFEITKSSLRFFIIGPPLITCISIVAFLVVTLYIKTFKNDHLSVAPPSESIKEIQLKNEQLLNMNRELHIKNSNLTKTLDISKNNTPNASPSPATPSAKIEKKGDIESLALFPVLPGRKDQTEVPLLSLKQEQLAVENGNIIFTFGMANKQAEEDSRISGYLMVMMKYDNTLHFYPGSTLNQKLQSPHNTGESFSFSKYRPVKAVFPYKKQSEDEDEEKDENLLGKNFFFKVFVFSKEGDLLHQQIFRKKYK